MALIDVADKNQIKIIQNRIKKDCIEFNNLSVGNKVKASNQLYMENRILKELGNAAVETIEKMDEEIEYKDNKINVLEQELKEVNK
jgi:flagellar biosynthesis/type III secretory pathway ATPase